MKTDRRDALRLAQLFRAGELVAVYVPSEENESLRDLVRAREDVVEDRCEQDTGYPSSCFDITAILRRVCEPGVACIGGGWTLSRGRIGESR